jgi:hypothetical protein
VEKFDPVTLGHGCRNILIYCGSINCSHSATMNADRLPDDIVIRALGPKMVCTKCGQSVPMCAPISRHMSIKSTSSSLASIGLG